MSTYRIELSEVEIACGVTLDDVAAELPRVLMRGNDTVHIDGSLAPALAGAVARCALGTENYDFTGTGKHTGYLIYTAR